MTVSKPTSLGCAMFREPFRLRPWREGRALLLRPSPAPSRHVARIFKVFDTPVPKRLAMPSAVFLARPGPAPSSNARRASRQSSNSAQRLGPARRSALLRASARCTRRLRRSTASREAGTENFSPVESISVFATLAIYADWRTDI